MIGPRISILPRKVNIFVTGFTVTRKQQIQISPVTGPHAGSQGCLPCRPCRLYRPVSAHILPDWHLSAPVGPGRAPSAPSAIGPIGPIGPYRPPSAPIGQYVCITYNNDSDVQTTERSSRPAPGHVQQARWCSIGLRACEMGPGRVFIKTANTKKEKKYVPGQWRYEQQMCVFLNLF